MVTTLSAIRPQSSSDPHHRPQDPPSPPLSAPDPDPTAPSPVYPPVIRTLIFILLALSATLARAIDPPLVVNDQLPTSAVLILTNAPSSNLPPDLLLDIAQSPMLRTLGHIPGALDTRDIVRLRRDIASPIDTPPFHTPIATLLIERDSETRSLTLTQLDPTTYALIDPDHPTTAHPIKRSDLADLPIDITMLEQGPTPALTPQLARDMFSDTSNLVWTAPHTQSPILFDRATLRSRIKNNFPPLTRTLGDETFRVRFTNTMTPDNPPGVLLWISPSEYAGIPTAVYPAADELNLIVVGIDNNGNNRPITDRLQNVLDALETLRAHLRIDESRVYASGLSGGGRCSSILFLACPDLITGAVPIVGLDSYHRIPTGQPNLFWAGNVGRPPGKLFKQCKEHRLRAITGTMDFNEPEMALRIKALKADNLDVKLDTIDGMGHTMPTAEQFTQALTWVDTKQRTRAQNAATKAQEELDKALTNNPDPRTNIPTRRALIDITINAPWSKPAHKAAHRLGLTD